MFALSGLPNDAARALWDGPVRRSFQYDPPFAASLLRQISKLEIRSPAGLYLGTVDAISADRGRIDMVLSKHVRGLIYHHYGETLPNDAEVASYQLVGNPNLGSIPEVAMTVIRNLSPVVRLGESVAYQYGKPSDEPRVSTLLLQYFGQQTFLVMAGPAGWLPPDNGG